MDSISIEYYWVLVLGSLDIGKYSNKVRVERKIPEM